jgi:tripartite-type tricarboxylate transporter receptor subunit TctC
MAEATELPEFSINEWVGLLLPAGTPTDVVNKLHAEVVGVLSSTDARKKLSIIGVEPTTSTPDEFSSFIRAEITKWTRVIRAAGLL